MRLALRLSAKGCAVSDRVHCARCGRFARHRVAIVGDPSRAGAYYGEQYLGLSSSETYQEWWYCKHCNAIPNGERWTRGTEDIDRQIRLLQCDRDDRLKLLEQLAR